MNLQAASVKWVALLCVGLLQGGVVLDAGRDEEGNGKEIPIVVRPEVSSQFVNDTHLIGIRREIAHLVGKDEIGKVRVDIGFYGSGLQIKARAALPRIKWRTYCIEREIFLTNRDWNQIPPRISKRGSDATISWICERRARSLRSFCFGETEVTLHVPDCLSYDRFRVLLDMVRRGAFTFAPSVENKRKPRIDEILRIIVTAEGVYEVDAMIPGSNTTNPHFVYSCRMSNGVFHVLERTFVVY